MLASGIVIPRKILAMKLRAMGDTVLMTAPLAELRRAFPEAEIHAAVLTRWAPLLENHPAVDKVIPFERHKEATSRAKALARLALRLRAERYDWVVNFHASPSSATVCFASGAKTRSIHFHGHQDRNRYSTVEVPGKGTLKPIIERDMDAIRALGVHVPAGRLPRVYVQPTERREAAMLLARLGLTGPLLTLGLGASRPAKSWPLDRFARLSVDWCRAESGSVLVVAGPAEQELALEFVRILPDALAGLPAEESMAIRARIAVQSSLTVRALAALIERSAAYMGNDSGPKHVAVAVQTPTVTVFGPEQPFEWHPYPLDRNPYVFIDGLPCRRDADPGMLAWCGVQDCVPRPEQHRCMTTIGAGEVLALCRKVASRDGSRGVEWSVS